MEFDFSNLDGAAVTAENTAIFTFYDLPGEPWLLVRAGGDLNRPYFAAILASQSKNRKRLMRGKVDADMLERNREVDRKLYPQHLDGGDMGGWRNRGSKDPLPYSAEAWSQVIQKLPADLFDELRAFCNEAGNFRSDSEPDKNDVQETAEN